MHVSEKKMHPAWLSKKLKNGSVECLACSHHCRISPGYKGVCGVRKNIDGDLQLLVYGRAAAINIDPIEKKPLFHFYPNTPVFSFGTVGCNFRCTFCQNWDISQFQKTHNDEEIMDAGTELTPEEIIKTCLRQKIPAVAFTYNEPGIFFEYAYDTAKLAKENGLKTVYVSNGFESHEALTKIKPYLDAINTDLKGFTEDYYVKICGGRLEPVKENIKWIWENGIWQEVTTLITTNHNDSDEEIKNIADFLASISPDMPWHISRYFPAYQMDDPPTPFKTLEKAYKIGKEAGLRYVYVGNVLSEGMEDTYCPKCKKAVITRTGYMVENLLKKDACPYCKEKIPGRF
jgi:pyruvate formate lyase activating enzyme